MARGELRVGTSGYQYDHWKGVFYPNGLSKNEWFEHYASHFDTVEINNTFYNLPQAATFDTWRDRAPNGFRYVLKFSRYGTHMKKLKDPEASLGVFLERAERLKAFLGPILVQLPPHWKCAPERLDAFLAAAPKRHRWAVELRDTSWLCEETYAVLRKHGAALCIHDMIPDHPEVLTATWTYLRFHGPQHTRKYQGEYPHQTLKGVATRIRGYLDSGKDVYAYFNNDQHGYAVKNALQLRRYVEQPGGES
ncbi:MAG: DUF72 domain-containing protein [Candidatus Hydrogenedentota bacterium]